MGCCAVLDGRSSRLCSQPGAYINRQLQEFVVEFFRFDNMIKDLKKRFEILLIKSGDITNLNSSTVSDAKLRNNLEILERKILKKIDTTREN